MTSRRRRRDEWRQNKSGLWTLSIGRRGQRVTLFQTTKDGNFYRSVYDPEHGRNRKSLDTKDRDEARRLGEALYESLKRGRVIDRPSVVRFGELADAFVVEAPTFHAAKESTRRDTRMRVATLRAVIGDHRDVLTLREEDVRAYEQRRLAGGIRLASGTVTPAVRRRSAQADVKVLKQMLRWACTRTSPGGGGAWLTSNPLQYVRTRGERSPNRPVATEVRYNATIEAMRKRQRRYTNEAQATTSARGRRRAEERAWGWLRAEFALWLIRRTGHRRGAVMGLRWDDFDFGARKVVWRPETNKSERRAEVPYPEEFFDTVREYQRRLGGFGGCVFATRDDPAKPLPKEMLSQWVRTAEDDAGLPKIKHGGVHSYRRLWVSERPNVPRKALMVAGGWVDEGTLTRCYDHPTDEDILLVTAEVVRTPSGAVNVAAS